MRKTLLTSTPAALLLLAASGATQAADTATLTMTGTIAPTACTPSFSNGGGVDYGYIASDSLSESAATTLESKPITFSVNCSAPTKISFSATDNRPGTVFAGYSTGLGLSLDSNGNKIGYYVPSVILASAQVDGNPARLKTQKVDGIQYEDTISIRNARTYTWGPTGSSVVIADIPFITTASVNLAIHTFIAPKNSLDLTDDINLDGNATFTLVYL